MIHTNSTVADKSLTKLQLHVHDKRYTDLFDTMKSQSKRKRKKKKLWKTCHTIMILW